MAALSVFSNGLKKISLSQKNRLHYICLKPQSRVYSNENLDELEADAEEKPERRFFKKPQTIDGFQVFDVYMNKKKDESLMRKKYIEHEKADKDYLAREQKMSTEQDWTNAWPTMTTFKQNAVPLPIRQGYIKSRCENKGLPPTKYGNTELMKIQNFLHLTPPHIKKQCQAIKKFCTPWPQNLDTDTKCKAHFPIETTTSIYIYDGPSLRDDRARIVTLKVNVEGLELDKRSKEKLILLAEHRYEKLTDTLTIIADRCPFRRQNEDYANYLLTTLYFESKNFEEWENEITENDRISYNWEESASKNNISNILISEEGNDKKVMKDYKRSITKVFEEGESKVNLDAYKASVMNILNLKKANDANL